MEFVNKAFKIVTALSPVLILVVYLFQLKAMNKQNNQNLFKIRLEYISKSTALITDIGRLFVEISSCIEDKDSLNNTCRILYSKQKEITSMIPETDLLFDKNITKIILDLIMLIEKTSYEVINIARENNISNEDKKNNILKLGEKFSNELQNTKIFTLLCDCTRIK